MEYHSGAVYKGLWLNGEKQGEGELHTAEGHLYKGLFLADKQHGDGKFTKKRLAFE